MIVRSSSAKPAPHTQLLVAHAQGGLTSCWVATVERPVSRLRMLFTTAIYLSTFVWALCSVSVEAFTESAASLLKASSTLHPTSHESLLVLRLRSDNHDEGQPPHSLPISITAGFVKANWGGMPHAPALSPSLEMAQQSAGAGSK
jgi:hypothetical protein